MQRWLRWPPLLIPEFVWQNEREGVGAELGRFAAVSGGGARTQPVGGGQGLAAGPGDAWAADGAVGKGVAGTALFVKSPTGYALTEAGVQLLERAEAAEQAMRMATAEVAEPTDQLRGQIRIGAPDGCANYLLPQVCAAMVRRQSQLDIQIVALPRVFNLSGAKPIWRLASAPPQRGDWWCRK